MTIVEQLQNHDGKPVYFDTLNQFKRAAVAHRIGISTAYLSNILAGSKTPSKDLNRKLQKLADDIEAEMRGGVA